MAAQRVLMMGNDAIGEGAIRAGCDAYFGYPITPQNELTAYMAEHMPKHGRVFIQAESELAAINMVFGAAVAGKRAMTSSSSPGISLKQEGLSYLAGCELPAVVVNVQRGGPGLGNIGPGQADYFQATKGGGHGDYRLVVLAPDSVQEMHDLTVLAFELADRYRNPAMVLTDGRLGQMMEPLVLRDEPPPRPPPKPWALTGAAGRAPQRVCSLLLEDGALERHNEKIQQKLAVIEREEIRFEERATDDCDILLVAYGTSARIAKGAVAAAREEGLRLGLFRPITLWPFPREPLGAMGRRTGVVLVIEMSAGQMLEDVRLAVGDGPEVHFIGRTGGGVPDVKNVLDVARRVSKRGGRADHAARTRGAGL